MTGAHGIQLVLADVDGTLVTKEKILTDRAIKAVQALGEAGIRFAITSGRPPKGMEMLIEPLAIDTPVAGFNGGMMTDPQLKPLEERIIPADVAREALKLILDAGLDAWVYAGADWVVRKKDAPHVDREAWTVKFPPKVDEDFEPYLDRAVKIVGVSDDLALMQKIEHQAQDSFGERVTAARSQPYYLDVTHQLANKGAVVEFLSKHLDIPHDAIATLGDQPNDMRMFRRSGFSIAMGNAPDEVKEGADAVTDSSEDEGFAKAIEKLILRKGS